MLPCSETPRNLPMSQFSDDFHQSHAFPPILGPILASIPVSIIWSIPTKNTYPSAWITLLSGQTIKRQLISTPHQAHKPDQTAITLKPDKRMKPFGQIFSIKHGTDIWLVRNRTTIFHFSCTCCLLNKKWTHLLSLIWKNPPIISAMETSNQYQWTHTKKMCQDHIQETRLPIRNERKENINLNDFKCITGNFSTFMHTFAFLDKIVDSWSFCLLP